MAGAYLKEWDWSRSPASRLEPATPVGIVAVAIANPLRSIAARPHGQPTAR